ncbi:MAG: hypothetical protein NVS4B7_05560 [Ktedonobacteraceae bacterium]
MNTITTSASIEQTKMHSAHPSFLGMLRGELFKISRQWTTWIMTVMLIGIIALPYIITLTVPNAKDAINSTPLQFLTIRTQSNLAVLRAFSGFFLIILTARVIGLEYQLGTIRVILARGVGRLQLLLVKLITIVLVALVILVAGLLLNLALLYSLVFLLAGNVNAFNALTAAFWSDTWFYILTVMISMGVTILLTTAVTVLGRSLAFGLSVGLSWFAADNLGTVFMLLANRLTHNDFWLNVTAYFLGPNLNQMPTALISKQTFSIGAPPLVDVDGPHTLLVALVYALIFAVVAVVLTWRRDVKE